MGCISVTARCTGADNEQEEDLVQIPSTFRRQSVVPVSGKEAACPHELDVLINTEEKELLWGRSWRELEKTLFTEPVIGWEGEKLEALGDIVWASQVILHDNHSQEDNKRYLILFPNHLLLLAMDDEGNRFIYQGLLPLSGISVKQLVDVTFEISGSMFESRVITCENQEEFKIWMAHLPRRVKKASVYRPHKQELLSILVPCDEPWKKQHLKTYLLQHPIRGWEGTPIQHLGKITFLSMVRVRSTDSQVFEERILVLFSDELVILSIDDQQTTVQYEGRLPTHSIKALERSALANHLEFEISGNMMESMLVSCSRPDDYQKWLFHLQKPDYSTNTLPLNGQLPPKPPKKRKSCHY